MYTIEAVEEMLGQIVDEIPGMFFERLNGGITLLEACKEHPQGQGDLYIMGEYSVQRGLGRRICIYYGSFMRMYAYAPEEVLRRKLRESLQHELTHHLESLAGERDLAIQDQIDLNEYRRVRMKREKGIESDKF